MTTTVLLIDDHPVLRQGVRVLLEREMTVHEVASATEALDAVPRERPDVAVIDVQLPDGDGVELVRTLRRRHPDVACVILTGSPERHIRYEAAAAGASAFLTKGMPGNELVDAIRRVAGGENLIGSSTFDVPEQQPGHMPTDPLLDQLSPQERRVVSLVVDGMTNKQAADELGLAETTVRNYLSTVLRKLNLKNRTELAAYVTRVSVKSRMESSGAGRGARPSA